MAYYQSNTNSNDVIEVGDSGLNPNLINGRTEVPSLPNSITTDSLNSATPINLPQYPTDANASSYNSSIPTPSIDSIVNTTPTQAEQKQQSILERIAGLVGVSRSQNELINSSETNAGVPALTSTLNDLNTQLEGLNNQSVALQNESTTIPFKTEEQFSGTGATRGGVAPITASALRQNAIKQAAISSQSLTLKSAIFGAQGKLSLAKDAADKAAQAQFENQEKQISYQKALLDSILPTLNREEKAQALIQQAKLNDRQTKIDQAKEDKKTILALATATLKNYPSDSAAHYAAQQALSESNKDVPDVTKALELVGQYQTDPVATRRAVLENQKIQSDINKNNAATELEKASNVDIPAVIATVKNPNETRKEFGGLTLNGLQQKAQTYMTNGGNIQGLGLSSSGNSGVQRTLIANYAGYLASQAGLDIPQITALYKANSKAATQIIGRVAKVDATSAALSAQFPRLQQLAGSVGNLGITESDLTKGKTEISRKFGSIDAANYVELIQTVRGDYASMQAALAGSNGGQFFAESAKEAIPLGLTPEQYAGIAETIKQSAQNASQATGQEAQKLIGTSSIKTGGSTYQGITLPN